MKDRTRTASALIIGNELLSGKIADANLIVLARALRALGVRLKRAVMVLDEVEVIAQEVKHLSATHDWVFTSGGVGPTHDDLTVEAVAQAFGTKVVVSPEIKELLVNYYGGKATESHLLMARIPEGARLVSSEKVPWPTVLMENVWVLPGVPEIFQMKLPLIRTVLGGGKPFVSLSVFTTLDEGQLKPMLDRVVLAHPDVEIGSYPQWGSAECRTKLTFDGMLEERVRMARDSFAGLLPQGTLVRVE